MTPPPSPTLFGDGIELPHNAVTMVHTAEMFGARCAFHDTKGLARSDVIRAQLGARFQAASVEAMQSDSDRFVACDNVPGAANVYGFRLKRCHRWSLAVGNERRGLSHSVRAGATDAIQIPMISRRINCLNVAAASAVALHYLVRGGGGPMGVHRAPEHRRPEVLIIGPGDHVELGSTLRSAAAFGWRRVLVDDREGVWFGAPRSRQREGRAAARRARNDIRVVPCATNGELHFEEAVVISTITGDIPLHRANLARGPGQLVVLPDEGELGTTVDGLRGLAKRIRFVRLEIPASEFHYHLRLTSSIALAEASRQIGRRAPGTRAATRPPIYDRALELASEELGEVVPMDELREY